LNTERITVSNTTPRGGVTQKKRSSELGNQIHHAQTCSDERDVEEIRQLGRRIQKKCVVGQVAEKDRVLIHQGGGARPRK